MIKVIFYDKFIESQMTPFLITLISMSIIFILTIIFVIIELRKVDKKKKRGVK